MKKLLWFTVGFGAVCLLCVYCLADRRTGVPALIFLGLYIVLRLMGTRWELLRRAAVPALGCALAFGWFFVFRVAYLEPLLPLDGTEQTLTVQITDAPEASSYGKQAEGWFRYDGKLYRARIYLDEDQTLTLGDRVTAQFRVRLTLPGAQRDSLTATGKGLFAYCTQLEPGAVDTAYRGAWYLLPARAAQSVEKMLESCFGDDVVPFVKALLLGDTDELDYETDTALKLSGIRHVAAVSGLHVGMLFALLQSLTFHRRVPTALFGIPLLAFFAAMAGFTPSVSRACLMVGLSMLAQTFLREYDSPTALSFGILVLLLINPFCAASVSLQLSAASVAGILAFQPKLHAWGKEKLDAAFSRGVVRSAAMSIWDSLCISLSAMTFTTPLSAIYFGTISLAAILTNLLTLWAVSLVFSGCVLTCAAGFVFFPAGELLGSVLSWPCRYILWIAKAIAKFPLAAVYTKSAWIVAWLVLCYLLLAAFLLLRGKPGMYAGLGLVSLMAAVALSWLLPEADSFRATVLDVGQGQCILLQSRGEAYLVDCGGDSDETSADAAAAALLSQGIFRLDGIIVTHTDEDHVGGLKYLLTRVRADTLILPAEDADETWKELRALVGETRFSRGKETLSLGDGTLTLLSTSGASSGNDNGICVLFETDECGILITGDRSADAELALLRTYTLPTVDILVAGHHGSASSTSAVLLDAVRPSTVAISVGENNLYGHPAAETLERLEIRGCTIKRTDKDGDILFRR